MSILVDSSVWIDYFRSGKYSDQLDYYIEQNIISTNDLILAELIPVLNKKMHSCIYFYELQNLSMRN